MQAKAEGRAPSRGWLSYRSLRRLLRCRYRSRRARNRRLLWHFRNLLLLNFFIGIQPKLLDSAQLTRERTPNVSHLFLSLADRPLLGVDSSFDLLCLVCVLLLTDDLPLGLILVQSLALALELVALLQELAEQVHDVFEGMVRNVIFEC